jgi:ABC-type microcin C transport system duplicated ATPase subunit YejF
MMGTVYETITIKNLRDINAVELGVKSEQEIRQATVKTVVETGAPTLFVTEELRQQLGLKVIGEKPVSMASGASEIAKRLEGVELHWKDRYMICYPYALSGGNEILLGAIPLEEMDLIVDPAREALVGAHGDEIVHRMPSVRW